MYKGVAALYEEKLRLQEALTEQEIRRQKNALERYQLGYQAQRDALSAEQREKTRKILAGYGYKYTPAP